MLQKKKKSSKDQGQNLAVSRLKNLDQVRSLWRESGLLGSLDTYDWELWIRGRAAALA